MGEENSNWRTTREAIGQINWKFGHGVQSRVLFFSSGTSFGVDVSWCPIGWAGFPLEASWG